MGSEFKLSIYRKRRVGSGGVDVPRGLVMAVPDIQMNDRMPRTCSSPEAYYYSET